MKIIHFTHNDLDGIGCVVVGAFIASAIKADYSYQCCAIGKQDTIIREKIHDIMDSDEEDVLVIVSDLGIDQQTQRLLNEFNSSFSRHCLWRDHHATNEVLYPEWGYVAEVDSNGIPTSATMMLLRTFKFTLGANLHENVFDKLKTFSTQVSRYDTWEWKNNPGDGSEEDLNIFFRENGQVKTIDYFIKRIAVVNTSVFSIDEENIEKIRWLKREREEYFKNAIERTRRISFIVDGRAFTVGALIPKEKHFNAELTAVYESAEFADIDFVVGIIPQNHSLALRSKYNSKLDLGKIAKVLGGGGHPHAAGAQVSVDEFLRILKNYYTELEKND